MTHDLTPLALIPAARPLARPRCAGLLGGLLALSALAPGIGHADGLPMPDSLVIAAADAGAAPAKPKGQRMWMTVGERRFAVTLADTGAARALAARLPMTLDMSELNGNEKKFDLPEALPADASRPRTLRNGDLMLYGTNTLVVFYLTFDSPYPYTRLGRVDDPAGLARALGPGSVRVQFTSQ